MILIGVHDRPVLVQQPVEPFGQHIAQLFGTGTFRAPERVIGILDDLSSIRSGLQPFVAIQQKNQSSL